MFLKFIMTIIYNILKCAFVAWLVKISSVTKFEFLQLWLFAVAIMIFIDLKISA